MDRNELFEKIIKKCDEIVYKKGKQSRRLNGKITFAPIYYSYQDDVITINKDPLSKEFELIKNSNSNPVLCTNQDGEIYRSHGEIAHIKDYILNLEI